VQDQIEAHRLGNGGQHLARIPPELFALIPWCRPAPLVADGSQFVKHILGPQRLKPGLRQGEFKRATIQFQSPPTHGRCWCWQAPQHRGGVVAKPNAHIQDAQRFTAHKTIQFGRFNEFGPSLIQRTSGVVECFAEVHAVETEASIGSRKGLEFPQICRMP
jgi:hypothetical protein